MYRADVETVLRCEQCNKPFDRGKSYSHHVPQDAHDMLIRVTLEATLKRHRYYCRSRNNINNIRSRSCSSCIKAKARCDTKRPQCSRCSLKATDCHYPATTSRDAGATKQNHVDAPTRQRKSTSLLESQPLHYHGHQPGSNGREMIFDNASNFEDSEFASLGTQSLPWDDTSIDFNFLSLPKNDNTFQYSSPASSTSWLFHQPGVLNDCSSQIQQYLISPHPSIPSAPSYSVRLLVHRPKRKVATQRTAGLILHILKSYPLMMMRHGSLPPFIHPGTVSSTTGSDDLKALNNCMSLVHMISAGVKGSRELFWKNVSLECERFCDEVGLSSPGIPRQRPPGTDGDGSIQSTISGKHLVLCKPN